MLRLRLNCSELYPSVGSLGTLLVGALIHIAMSPPARRLLCWVSVCAGTRLGSKDESDKDGPRPEGDAASQVWAADNGAMRCGSFHEVWKFS